MKNLIAQIDIGTKFFGGSNDLADPEKVGTLFVSNIITASLSLAGVALLFLLIMGGIGIISGSGSNNPEQLEKGKKAATSALIGFIVVISAYWIVKLIQGITGLNLLGT